MPRFSANLSMLFAELPFLERFEAAASAGFRAVEFAFPYEHDPQILADRLRRFGLEQVLHNLPPGDWSAGDRGLACDPGRIAEFQGSVERALTYAKALGCTRLNCLAGRRPERVSFERAQETLVANLRFAAAELRKAGVALLIEAINTIDMPGFFVSTSRHALAVLDEVGSDNLLFQYDVYHMQRMEGELARTIQASLPRIGHIQIADNPGRHEPGTGEINYGFLLPFLDEIGYSGWVGCEYVPRGTSRAGLEWMKTYSRP